MNFFLILNVFLILGLSTYSIYTEDIIVDFTTLLNFLLANPIDVSTYARKQYPDTKEVKQEYDIIIVGAGAAGCVLANRLSEIRQLSILLIEAGGDESLIYDVPATAVTLQQSKVDWQYLTAPCKNCSYGIIERKNAVPKGKVVGGSSSINFMIYTRGNQENYNRWEKVFHNPGWGFKDIEKYFKKLEDYHVYDPEYAHHFGSNGPMHVQISPYRSKVSKAILKSVEESGIKILNYNGPDQLGFSPLQSTVKDGYRYSANKAYLMPIRNSRPNLHLKKKCLVTRILFDTTAKTLAKGVELICETGKKHTVYAKQEVIISAGVINTPQLLMLSGIGPKTHLKELGIPVVKHLPVGNNLMDHYSVYGVQFLLNQSQFDYLEAPLYPITKTGPITTPSFTEVIGYTQPHANGLPLIEHFFLSIGSNLFFSKTQRIKPEINDIVYKPYELTPAFLDFPTLLQPKSRGYVRLKNTNPFSHPHIQSDFVSYSEEVELLLKAFKEMLHFAEQPALKKMGARFLPVPLPDCKEHEFLSDDYLRCHISTMTFSIYHQCGTCKMGPKNDLTTVVDSKLRVHGVKKLRIIDASIMPEIICGHLYAPTMMIAEKGADMIKQKLFSKT